MYLKIYYLGQINVTIINLMQLSHLIISLIYRSTNKIGIWSAKEKGYDVEKLIKKAQKGGEEAFIQAITEYMPVMYKVARTRLSSEDDIGDAIQESILSAFKNLKSLKNPNYFRTWLIRILINQCNDISKENSKVICIGSYEEAEKLTKAVCDDNVIDAMDFNQILMQLSIDYKTVVVLYYVNGFNTREISEILDEKEGTIKSRLSRAREQLKVNYDGLLEVR